MKKKQIKGMLLLLLAAIIWGSAFVAQSVGMEYVGPLTFNCVRTLIGGIVLIPCITLLNHGKVKKDDEFREKKINDRGNLLWNCACNRKYTSTIWNYVHNSRKSRIYHSFLHYYRSHSWFAIRKKMWIICLDQCYDCFDRTLFFMYYRWLFDWERR